MAFTSELLAGVASPPSWQRDALCREPIYAALDFFASDPSRIAEAAAVCAGCPVDGECADYARDTRAPWGVWGGRTARQLRRDRRGR